ncbi:sigma-54-dependent Fis family transcriptional regulator [Paraburkholderia phosphatilytica]|uniref:sigma-54-dependent Fis family transcriptional regulator n=1 Tax=Paraburkholderia phosphatilytica TaxID=2282883 RepID=UPI000E546910|nr:sigma-54-dependent Fis family transcriptional regulator [Paraburkholderia phosphatilytica]
MASHSLAPTAAARADVLAQAHARSQRCGLRASEAPDFQPLRELALRELIDGNHTLYTHALPVMETLHAQIVDTESMVLLTDRDGTILHSLGDSDFVEKARRVALCPGVSWAETDRGTNAIGTALVDHQPTVVHAGEHFLHANSILTCSCAPIADPFGRVVGALDVSGDTRGYHKHTLALVRMSAQMIENQLFANQFVDAVRVHFHARAEFVGTLFEGLAAFAPDGTFLSANRSALFQFGVALDALQRQPFDALFGTPLHAMLRACSNGNGMATLMLPSGVRVVARADYAAQRGVPVSALDGGRGWDDTRSMPQRMPARAPRLTDPATPPVTLASLDTGDARMSAVLARVAKVRGRDIPILVLGRTGTGKEWLARAIHDASPRRDAPFVAVNCASLPDTLIEAELFGYEDGAFTGAKKRGSAGKIVQADGGTLFLDEIGDMPLAQQVRLMRVLQEREVVPLGGTRPVPVDLRIVCATHRDLRAMIADGTFREDLYYRINGLVVTLPPLAERTDLAVLVGRILDAQQHDAAAPRQVSDAVLGRFARCRWPGNLRQLANVLRTAAIMAESAPLIELEHLPDDLAADCEPDEDVAVPSSVSTETSSHLRGGRATHGAGCTDAANQTAQPGATNRTIPPSPASGNATNMQDWQASLIERTLARHDGNVSATARELGLARNTVYRYLRLRRAH